MPGGRDLPVFLTVDVGPDDAILGAGDSEAGSWTRTHEGLGGLLHVLGEVEKASGLRPVVTWFVRADALIESQFGSALAVFHSVMPVLEARLSRGDELAWMPQLYSRDDSRVRYRDLNRVHGQLTEAGFAPVSVRMGNCYHDNRSIAVLAALGIEFDSSAVPGRSRLDGGWRMDWTGTPATAYHPSVHDYRVAGEPGLEILEIPMSVVEMKAPYDAGPLLRYVNPCMRPEFLWPSLEKGLDSVPYLLCTSHPDEVVARKDGHPLIAYSQNVFRENLLAIVRESAAIGRQVAFRSVRSFHA